MHLKIFNMLHMSNMFKYLKWFRFGEGSATPVKVELLNMFNMFDLRGPAVPVFKTNLCFENKKVLKTETLF